MPEAARETSCDWTVTGMDCGSCATKIKDAVTRLPGVSGVEVGIMSERLRLTLDEGQTGRDKIEKTVRALGYEIAPRAADIDRSNQFPMHLWLDEAMEGPNPASILRNSVVVTCGAIVLLKLMPVVAVSPLATTVLLAVGSISAIGGGLVAVAQVDLKRAFSYSTTSYLGLVFITIALQMPGLGLHPGLQGLPRAFDLNLGRTPLPCAHGAARHLQLGGVQRQAQARVGLLPAALPLGAELGLALGLPGLHMVFQPGPALQPLQAALRVLQVDLELPLPIARRQQARHLALQPGPGPGPLAGQR